LGVTEIAEAADGVRGLEELRGFAADIVICDWNMAPMTGIEFLRVVRTENDSLNPAVPFLMLTSSSELNRVLETRETGATEYLAKPVTSASLSERIATVIDGAGAGTARGCGYFSAPAAAEESGDDAFLAMQTKIEGTSINEQTLLATDYLNHFNEVLMILGMVADVPEILDRAKEWQPKTYAQHFKDSNLSERDLMIAAYELAPSMYRLPFDETVSALNSMVVDGVREIENTAASGDKTAVEDVSATVLVNLRQTMEKTNGIIQGAVPTMAQDEIDKLFD
jgi:CheY-like chemotaxis protein